VVGDLGGFAASVVRRGVDYVQVPTSLLAQVDSSVGGKTAINHPLGKNMVGAFHQPGLVLIDPLCLDTLPPRELRAGYAEVVKYGLLGDAAFFAWCEANGRKLLDGDPAAREHAIAICVAAKAAIVAADERETTGQRALLNLGHSFAHALEAEAGFSDILLHGEAVALGLVLAFRLSAERGLCSGAEAARVATHLESTGLPTRLEIGTGASLTAHIARDKKAEGGRAPLILARGIGQAFVDRSVPLAEVADFLDRQRQMALVTN
jgi:3-dehydroquinate synthase